MQFFLFLLQNIDCGYSLEPPHRCIPTINVWSENIKNIKFLPKKDSIFTAEKKSLFIAWVSFRNADELSRVMTRS